MADLRTALPATCDVLVPTPDTKVDELLPNRWSRTLISAPHAIVIPTTIPDIVATIKYATSHDLKLIPSGGARGFFVPITHDVIYLDLRHFSSFQLNEEKREVTFGGGCISGPLLKGLAEKGWYTGTPSGNGVGMTGALLGGLNHPLVGLHGMGRDMVKSFTIVPFSMPYGGELGAVTVTRDSENEEKKLFDVLRGAGHGMGVVVSATMEAHPLAGLELEGRDKVWQRTLAFPPNAIDAAGDAYLALHTHAPPNLSFFIGFMRAPPNAPRPGAPVILLAVSFFGPVATAEIATSITFSDAVLSKTVNATTTLTPFGDIHNALDPLNAPGGYKELHGASVKSIRASSLTRAFASFLSYTDGRPELFGTAVIFPASNTAKSESLAAKEDFYNPRDRGIFVQVKTSCPAADDKDEADAFAKSVHEIAREEDRKAGRRDWGFANNMVEGMDLKDVYTPEQIGEIARVASFWNKGGVGWCPTAAAWRWYTWSRENGGKPGTILQALVDEVGP
ncbi:FAD-binding domain-containing protein [Paraphaeosphaeria sporulosa]|uniref:FAD-binding domain-containing protein n=1 Tax=Paraphaeosphaeria sporulosa TaxID=1460663 RepID=A0A177CFZ5_9PLEO|nr:FAD-binding domain-containing protein [Paraphaeosphaeria sporulosa]OAG06533.1 FAD-binding domain-containing protein [Paraphaeosphaeria sporulosa]